MSHTGCEHCGYVRRFEQAEAANGFGEHCPDCGRQLAEVTVAEARELIRERLTARRFRSLTRARRQDTALPL